MLEGAETGVPIVVETLSPSVSCSARLDLLEFPLRAGAMCQVSQFDISPASPDMATGDESQVETATQSVITVISVTDNLYSLCSQLFG